MSNLLVKRRNDKVKRYVGYFFFFSNPCLVSGKKFIFIVVQRDLRGIRKLWSLLCSWWWISLCLQSLLQPQTPGKMRRWNVSPHVVKSNTSHNGTLEDSHLGLKTTQQSRTGENTCHIGLSTQTHRLRGQLRIDIYLIEHTKKLISSSFKLKQTTNNCGLI